MVSIATNLLFVIAFLGPITYGFMRYNWDLAEYVNPNYVPPNISFSSSIKGFNYSDNRLYIFLMVDNMGEVDVSMNYLNATLYGEDGRAITDVYLESPVNILHNTSKEMIMYMLLNSSSVENLVKYYLETNNLRFIIRGSLGVEVYSSLAVFPLQIPVNVPEEFLNKYLIGVDGNITEIKVSREGVIFILELINPTIVSWTIYGIDLKLYTETGVLIGYLGLKNHVVIPSEGISEAELVLTFVPDAYNLLIKYFGGADEKFFNIEGDVTLEYNGYTYTFQLRQSVEISRDTLVG